MEDRRRQGRRSGSENRRKSFPVTTRYSPEEYAELEDAASQHGLTRASYQRVQSLAKPKTRSTRRAPIERELLAKVVGQLGKIGSNLNQIAHAANMEITLRSELGSALAELRALLPVLRNAMGWQDSLAGAAKSKQDAADEPEAGQP